MKKPNFFSDKIDMVLLVSSVLAALIGIFVINSASNTMDGHIKFVLVQCVALILGIGAMSAVIFFSYKYFEKLRFLIFGLGISLLILVLAIGKLSNGTQGWIELGPITVQPSEIAKICFIITLSIHISKKYDSINDKKTLLGLLVHLGCYVVPVILQPDFGTAMVFVVIFAFELLFAGLRKKYILSVCGIGAVITPIIWLLLEEYQRNRIISLFFPENDPTGSGYHVLQSELALGSGMIWGRGYMQGPQTQYGYLPERHTDFVYSVIGEEFGLIGALIVAVILFIIVYRCFDNAKSCSHDTFGEMICIGVGSMMFFHVLENIGMCLGIMPITGIPLPFISYGGSNLVTCFIAIGLVQNVRMRRRATKFDFDIETLE
ncbi:MAG: rod shape-determining protein RodA [Ruminococcaceae bacterium]|nr:rod shape-determining protein RodA [Oscillospiraceae bacterium]